MKRKKQEQPECAGLCSMCGKDNWHCMCLSDAFNLVLKQMRNPKRTMNVDQNKIDAVKRRLKQLEKTWPDGCILIVLDGSQHINLYDRHPEEGGTMIAEYKIRADSTGHID